MNMMLHGSEIWKRYEINSLRDTNKLHRYNNYNRRENYIKFLKQSGYIYEKYSGNNIKKEWKEIDKILDIEDVHKYIAKFI
jgi:hypothetical protein